MNIITKTLLAAALTTATVVPAFAAPTQQDGMMPMASTMKNQTGAFKGAEVNGGFATLDRMDGKAILKLSPDFKIPASPAPHFQIVDKAGNVYLLQRLTIVGNKTHRDVVLPKYIKNVAKVQIYCAFAEVVLGEASFASAQNTGY